MGSLAKWDDKRQGEDGPFLKKRWLIGKGDCHPDVIPYYYGEYEADTLFKSRQCPSEDPSDVPPRDSWKGDFAVLANPDQTKYTEDGQKRIGKEPMPTVHGGHFGHCDGGQKVEMTERSTLQLSDLQEGVHEVVFSNGEVGVIAREFFEKVDTVLQVRTASGQTRDVPVENLKTSHDLDMILFYQVQELSPCDLVSVTCEFRSHDAAKTRITPSMRGTVGIVEDDGWVLIKFHSMDPTMDDDLRKCKWVKLADRFKLRKVEPVKGMVSDDRGVAALLGIERQRSGEPVEESVSDEAPSEGKSATGSVTDEALFDVDEQCTLGDGGLVPPDLTTSIQSTDTDMAEIVDRSICRTPRFTEDSRCGRRAV